MPEPLRRFSKSFKNAFNGLVYFFKSQANARIELGITCVVIISGFLLKINNVEWIAVSLCIAVVLGLEALNSSFEMLADKLHPGIDDKIGKAKDVAAAAVLLAAAIAAIIGIIIFAPRLLSLFSN